MNSDIDADFNIDIYDEDFFDNLTNDFPLPSLLDVDASPDEILEEASPFLCSMSPTITESTLSPQTSISTTDSSSSDEENKTNSIASSVRDWLSQDRYDFISETGHAENNDLSVDEFIIKKEKLSPPNSQFHGPVVSTENGHIKIEVIDPETFSNPKSPTQYGNDSNQFSNICNIDVHKQSNLTQARSNFKNGNSNDNSSVIHGQVIHTKISQPVVGSNSLNPLVLMRNGKVPIAALVKPNHTSKEIKERKTLPMILPKEKNGVQKPILSAVATPNRAYNTPLMVFPTQCKPIPINSGVPQPKSPINILNNSTVQIVKELPKTNMNKDIDMVSSEHMSDFDLRAQKKHQRMIKNRESACLSRKKKRDYVMSLEQRLADAHQEIGRLQMENTMLKEQLSDRGKPPRKVPKLDPKSFIPRKNVAVLFAMVFMVSFNITFSPWLSRSYSPKQSVAVVENSAQRHLLWTDDENAESGEEILSRTKRSETPFTYINETESIRLAAELEKWIGTNSLNLSLNHSWKQNVKGFADHIGLSDNVLKKLIFSKSKPNLDETSKRRKRKNNFQSDLERSKELSKSKKDSYNYNVVFPKRVGSKLDRDYMNFEDFGEWEALVRALQMRDDTFYVVGVGRGDHLLLPATAHNNTRPPRMALILPAKKTNDSLLQEDVMLMQIDCSVVNTSIVTLKANAMPKRFRKKNDATDFNKDTYLKKEEKTDNLTMDSNLTNFKSKLERKHDIDKRTQIDDLWNFKAGAYKNISEGVHDNSIQQNIP